MNLDQTRKYIHDLANSFSIIDASLYRALKRISDQNPELKDEIQKLEMANEYVKKSIQTLRALREEVHNQINSK